MGLSWPSINMVELSVDMEVSFNKGEMLEMMYLFVDMLKQR